MMVPGLAARGGVGKGDSSAGGKKTVIARVESRGPSFFFDFRRPRRNNCNMLPDSFKRRGPFCAHASVCACV